MCWRMLQKCFERLLLCWGTRLIGVLWDRAMREVAFWERRVVFGYLHGLRIFSFAVVIFFDVSVDEKIDSSTETRQHTPSLGNP